MVKCMFCWAAFHRRDKRCNSDLHGSNQIHVNEYDVADRLYYTLPET